MKKTLFILCALLLTSIGASAQEVSTEYEFVCTYWVAMDPTYRAADNDITHDEAANTITISKDGNCNIALGNSTSYSADGPITTAEMYITSEQKYFVVVGSGLNTSYTDNTYSQLWWMNGYNNGLTAKPDYVVGLKDETTGEATGEALFAWECTNYLTAGEGGNITLNGWTGFGLTSTTGTSVISYIGFYDEDELDELISAQPYTFNATDWAATNDHTDGRTSVSYGADNTISVTSTTGDLNVALSNSPTAKDGDETIGITTGKYYINQDQTYFVVIGSSDLSTTSNESKLWWMNGANLGGVDPTVTELSEGKIMFVWDLSSSLSLPDEKNHFDGWTCFALKSSTGSSTIYDINFYTADEVEEMISGYDHFCTANIDHWTLTQTGSGTLGNFYVDYAEKDDGSGMEPPFLTYYVWEGEGATLSDATFTHETLTLEPGLYEVSMQIRVIDYDEGTIGEGTLFSATTGSTTVSQDIKLGVDANETTFNDSGDRDDIYGTYTLYVEVGEEGTLDVSLDITGATYNWIMFKNLTVRLLGEDETIPSGTVSGTMQAEYGTLILPFDATITDGLTAYTAGEVTNDADGESVLTLTAVDGNLTAGTPYIIGGSANTTYSFAGVPTKYEVSYTVGMLTGTLVDMTQADFTADGTQYVLQNHDEGGLAFYPITGASEGVTLSAYHCYLTYSNSSGVKGFISFPNTDDETTAIKAVESEEAEGNGAIYDLSGRKVSKAVKGVYIQNGKKVLVK